MGRLNWVVMVRMGLGAWLILCRVLSVSTEGPALSGGALARILPKVARPFQGLWTTARRVERHRPVCFRISHHGSEWLMMLEVDRP